jgi:hypothetical protein
METHELISSLFSIGDICPCCVHHDANSVELTETCDFEDNVPEECLPHSCCEDDEYFNDDFDNLDRTFELAEMYEDQLYNLKRGGKTTRSTSYVFRC